MNFLVKLIIIIALFNLFLSPISLFAVSDTINIAQEVYICDNNGICESGKGENANNCLSDCGCNNNGICEIEIRGENSGNCPYDCPAAIPITAIGDFTPPLIYNLLISEITLKSAVISWTTNEPAFCKLFWGKTREYEQESIAEDTFFYSEHSTKLINLLPQTLYHFRIFCKDTNQNGTETKDQKFTTLTPPDITPPANISEFEAIAGDRKITLKWQNPPDFDFKEVKIMRSTEFYPFEPWQGVPVYIGKETSFVNINLVNGVTYYYTAFSYDRTGNHSSGAVVSAIPQAPPMPPVKAPIKPPRPPILPVKPPIIPAPAEVEELTLEDFDFWQKAEKLPLIEATKVRLEAQEPLTISIDYEKVPEVLKTIMVTLEKDNKYFSFLLRINREKTKYLATIMPPEPGFYPIKFHVLDFKNQALKIIIGQFEVEELGRIKPFLEEHFSWYKRFRVWLYILIAIIFLGGIMYLIKIKHRGKRVSI